MTPRLLLIASVAALAACSSRTPQPRIAEIPVTQPNLGRTASTQDADAAAAGRRADSLRLAMAQQAGTTASAAMSSCAPDVCAAIGRNEMALGMNRAGVFAVTGSSPDGWTLRGSESAGTMIPARRDMKDRLAEVAMVTFRDGRVVSYTYREPSGLRTVASREDATPDARRRAIAQQLLEQGDAAVATGNADLALARYDQADVLEPNNAGTSLRIAKLLDQQMRPLEALMRYQKFLHEMEIERIEAKGKANAELAAAVVAAQARVVHLVETTRKSP
jgi:tetratricopeptide (TPR) repeat protein